MADFERDFPFLIENLIEGVVVSVKSTLEPTCRLLWLGKVVDFDPGVLSTAGAEWESLLVHWWRLVVERCTRHRLQQLIGTSQWVCRPCFGHVPFLSGLWATMLWSKPIIPHTSVGPLRSMVGVMVIAMQSWRVCPVRPFSVAKPLLFFVDAARDGALFRLGGFSCTMGVCTMVPEVQPFSQMGAQVLAMVCGLHLILNGNCLWHTFFWTMRRFPL